MKLFEAIFTSFLLDHYIIEFFIPLKFFTKMGGMFLVLAKNTVVFRVEEFIQGFHISKTVVNIIVHLEVSDYWFTKSHFGKSS